MAKILCIVGFIMAGKLYIDHAVKKNGKKKPKKEANDFRIEVEAQIDLPKFVEQESEIFTNGDLEEL